MSIGSENLRWELVCPDHENDQPEQRKSKKKKALNKIVIQFRQIKLEPQNERLVHNMSLEYETGKAKSENSTSLSTLRCNDFWMMSSRPFLDIFDFLPPGMQEESLEEVLTPVFCCWEPGQRATLTRWYC